MDLKHLLKRGALIVAANWPTVLIQFLAESTFQVLLGVPIIGAAILVALLLGGDLGEMLQGSLRQIFTTITSALLAEPIALTAFISSFAVVLVGGSVFMFLVKGGTVATLAVSNDAAGAIEREPLTLDLLQGVSRFSVPSFRAGCARFFRPYLSAGLLLMLVYGVSGGAYLAFLIYGYRAAAGFLIIGWTLAAAGASGLLIGWITFVNLVYLLFQIALAYGDETVGAAARTVSAFIRTEYRDLAGVFVVELGLVIVATLASTLAWSGVGLIAFVPLVGLAVIPLQIAALLVRGLVFEFIGLTALAAYLTIFRRYVGRSVDLPEFATDQPIGSGDPA